MRRDALSRPGVLLTREADGFGRARAAYVGAATGAFVIAMGGIFLAQGLRLDDSATVALAPLPGGGIGRLQLSF